jgi:arginine/lysine/ornithine decarboxylase
MPHRHPEDRVYTVLSGVFYVGLGDRFDAEQVNAYPPGTLLVLPGDTWHFHWAKSGEYVTQVTAIGRWASNTRTRTTIHEKWDRSRSTSFRFAT